MSYADLLRDPRWQRKRLEVMRRADFRCERCGDDRATLNVHHIEYVRGRMPWEYPDAELACLCRPCHGEEHGIEDVARKRARDDRAAQEERRRARMTAQQREMDDRIQSLTARIAAASGDPAEQDRLLIEKQVLARGIRTLRNSAPPRGNA